MKWSLVFFQYEPSRLKTRSLVQMGFECPSGLGAPVTTASLLLFQMLRHQQACRRLILC